MSMASQKQLPNAKQILVCFLLLVSTAILLVHGTDSLQAGPFFHVLRAYTVRQTAMNEAPEQPGRGSRS